MSSLFLAVEQYHKSVLSFFLPVTKYSEFSISLEKSEHFPNSSPRKKCFFVKNRQLTQSFGNGWVALETTANRNGTWYLI